MSTEAPTALRPDACPAPELLAAYMDGRLAPNDRTMVARHLVECGACRDIVGNGAMTADAGLQPRQPRKHLIAMAAATLATAAALLLAVCAAIPRLGRDGTEELRDALGATRPVEARLSGGFAYLPLQPLMRSQEQPAVTPQLLLTAAMLEKKAREIRSPASLRALGGAQLLIGNIDASIATLQEGARLAPRDNDTQVDLAAAHIARARQRNLVADYQTALAILDAIAGRPSGEALFNRALALEGLGQRDEAAAAWKRYLAADPGTGWADEARGRLAAIQR